jgi:hypothetical protein
MMTLSIGQATQTLTDLRNFKLSIFRLTQYSKELKNKIMAF